MLTSISHVSEHEMVETGHCENRFRIDVRPYPPVFTSMTTPSTVLRTNVSDIRKRHHIPCHEEHYTSPTLKTENKTSKSRMVHSRGCLEERNITREVHIGGCFSFSVHSYQPLTETIIFVVKKSRNRDIMISCYFVSWSIKMHLLFKPQFWSNILRQWLDCRFSDSRKGRRLRRICF